eukprot:5867718-Pyramimonas_sp.AAC.1
MLFPPRGLPEHPVLQKGQATGPAASRADLAGPARGGWRPSRSREHSRGEGGGGGGKPRSSLLLPGTSEGTTPPR